MPTFYQAAAQEVFDQLKRPASGLKNEVVPALQKNTGLVFCRRQNKNAKLVILLSMTVEKAGGITGEIRIAKACDDLKLNR